MPLPFSFQTAGAVRRAVVGTALAGAYAGAAPASTPAPAAPIAPDEIVSDRSQVEWSEAYLQWIAAFARGGSPISDTTGALCAARQEGEVWFLATSDGTQPVERACVVPAGRTLFVPIATTMERSGNREPDCGSMARIAAGTLTQHVSRLSLTIDGQAVDNLASHRGATRECFALGLRQVPRSTARTTVADGYYVMLQPLPAGAHTIAVGARFGDATLSTTYRLDVR
jgi:hypothetical protein